MSELEILLDQLHLLEGELRRVKEEEKLIIAKRVEILESIAKMKGTNESCRT